MGVAYLVRDQGGGWAVIRLYRDDREETVASGLPKEAAIERCFALLEELRRGAAVVGGGVPAEDIAPKRRRARQLQLKF